MLFKNLFRLALIVLVLLSCSSDDDPVLFMDKFDMTEWQWTENYCFPESDPGPHVFMLDYMRFEKNDPGFIRHVSYAFDWTCEQAYSKFWSFKEFKNPKITQIIEHTEDQISYILREKNEEGSLRHIRYTFTYKDEIMTKKTYYYSSESEHSFTYVKSEINIEEYLRD